MPQKSQTEAFSFADNKTTASDTGAFYFSVQQILLKIQTITLVQVLSCTNNGGLSPVGFVDVQPLVHQITGNGTLVPHGVIYNIPYARLQGGANAVIIDPKVGDIGMAGFCSRDISSVKKNKAPAPPASRRTFDYADGLYIGGMLNGSPSQFIRFHSGGIEIMSPGEVSIIGSSVSITSTGDVSIIASGAVDSTSQSFAANSQVPAEFTGGGGINVPDGDVKASNVSLVNHPTSGVVAGGEESGPPVPGA